jgi:hypothetical protein
VGVVWRGVCVGAGAEGGGLCSKIIQQKKTPEVSIELKLDKGNKLSLIKLKSAVNY